MAYPTYTRPQTTTANNQNTYADTWRTPAHRNRYQDTGRDPNSNPTPYEGPRYTSGQGTGQTSTYTPPSPWTPYQPQQTPMNQGTQQTYTPYQPEGLPTAPGGWNTQALRDQYSQYLNSQLALQQFNQNSQQYSQDFNEAQRRWNEQFGWTQNTDRFNMDLSGRQQQMAEWQAQEAARQWGEQFGWQQQNDRFSQDLANRQLAVEQAYNEGRISNEQRQIALNELTQQQDDAWRYHQLGQQLGFSREELAATQQWRQQQDALARWQMEQQIAADRQNAILQATGRNQAPNTRWMRRS
jgi:hypothetical protein